MPTRTRNLIAALTAATAVVGASVALAAPIPVASYTFTSSGDSASFQKVRGENCKRKQRAKKQLSITVGERTNNCAYRASVLGGSSGPSNLQISGQGFLSSTTPTKLQRKSYVGLAVRFSDSAAYELRVFPVSGKYQVFRDPAGSGANKLLVKGKGKKFVKLGIGKVQSMSIRAFGPSASSAGLLVRLNGHTVLSRVDAATDVPDGREAVLTTGVKGSGAGNNVQGVFDNVVISVPNPT